MHPTEDPEHRQRQDFTRRVLADLDHLETMLEEGSFETGIARIGAEQEVFLVDGDLRPAPVADAVLEDLADPHFTWELGRFNLEINLDPVELAGDALARFEAQAAALLGRLRDAAARHGARVVLCGILPTIRLEDLDDRAMTPRPRYHELDRAMRRLRGGSGYTLRIRGRDEVTTTHHNVLLEACNTSFQVHRQVDPARFARFYNAAQLLAAPVLAAAAGSPLLFGKALWRGTRIALFQQAVDTRPGRNDLRRERSRVTFGDRWIDDSVLEIFREDVSRFRVLLLDRSGDRGGADDGGSGRPDLSALALHNGTVYRWNRPCLGALDGRPHLRIENRILPSGPSLTDEIANAALWLGALEAVAADAGDVRRRISFETVRENFFAAARSGLECELAWLDGRRVTARDLVRLELVPMAREALRDRGVDGDDVDRLLRVVWQRVRHRRTGAQWMLERFDALAPAPEAERCAILTAEMIDHQESGLPVCEWSRRRPDRPGAPTARRVADLMTTDPYTVGADEILELAEFVMDWGGVRHLPVEDGSHRLVGLLTRDRLRRFVRQPEDRSRPVDVAMRRQVLTVRPSASLHEALALMIDERIGCLPVTEGGRLVGLLTREMLAANGGTARPPERDPLPQALGGDRKTPSPSRSSRGRD